MKSVTEYFHVSSEINLESLAEKERLYLRSLLSSEALVNDLCVAVDPKVVCGCVVGRGCYGSARAILQSGKRTASEDLHSCNKRLN